MAYHLIWLDHYRCEECFPPSELKRSLPKHLLAKMMEREQEDCLSRAGLANLERCPKPDCGFAMVIENDEDKVFRCPKCGANTCRKCHEDWSEHAARVARVQDPSELDNRVIAAATDPLRSTYNIRGHPPVPFWLDVAKLDNGDGTFDYSFTRLSQTLAVSAGPQRCQNLM